MATIADIRSAIKTTVEADLGDVHVYTYVPETVQPRCIVVVPSSGDARTMGRGVVEYIFNLIVVASTADSVAGQTALDEMLQTTGDAVLASIDSDKTLGLSGVNAHAAGWDDYGTSSFGDRDYYTATIPLRVLVTA